MEIQKLHPDVLSKIRSSFTINTVNQCVVELVLNSLDAKSTAIAVRLNLVTYRIQVVDNGEGILEENMKLAGRRYFTSKCKSLEHLEKHIKHYGFRGEALASIIECSKSVNITSKRANSSETYSITWGKHADNKVSRVRNRPSVGTTVTVEGIFYNLPLRRKRMINELELDEIVRNMESLMIMHPNVSFSVRNDITGELVLNSQKNKDLITSFNYLHPEVVGDFCFMKISKNKLAVDALLFKELSDNKRLQYIYVNKRPICSPKIQKLVCSLFHKFLKVGKKTAPAETVSRKYPVYVMNIKCPHSKLDILLNSTKTMVEFENWPEVQRCIEKVIQAFFGDDNKSQKKAKPVVAEQGLKKDGGVSEMGGVFRSYGYKRKTVENETKTPEKLIRLENESIIESKKDSCATNKANDVVANSLLEVALPSKQISRNEVIAEKNSETETNHISLSPSINVGDGRGRIKVKKPLPIKVVRKQAKPKKLQTIEEEKPAPHLPDDAKSTLSKFTNDQTKGKSLIMNMFLKSTQIFSSDENLGELSASQETVYEEESNFLMENNYQTNVNGISNAMSVSVNVRSTRKIRKARKASKGVQTSLEVNEMVTKGLQTTLEGRHVQGRSKKRTVGLSKGGDNYTVVLSNSGTVPSFKFVKRDVEEPEVKSIGAFRVLRGCTCNCHQDTSKYFDFNKENLCNDHSNKTAHKNAEVITSFEQVKENKDFAFHGTPKAWGGGVERKDHIVQNKQIYATSPYFAAKRNVEMFHNNMARYPKPPVYPCLREHYYNPYLPHYQYGLNNPNPGLYPYIPQYQMWQNCRPNLLPTEDVLPSVAHNYFQTQLETGENTMDALEWTIDSFGKFKPAYLSTQQNVKNDEIRDRTELVFTVSPGKNPDTEVDSVANLLSVSQINNEQQWPEELRLEPSRVEAVAGKDETKNAKDCIETCTVLNTQKTVDEELEAEKSLLAKEFLKWNSQFTESVKGGIEVDNWMKKINNFGSTYYINKKTGFATFDTPKPDKAHFKLAERFEFMPKGMSPILKETKQVDMSLSQLSKDRLLEYIMETYKNELLYIKWQHYLNDMDPKTFFENMYKEKLKMFEDCIPDISTTKKTKHPADIISFTKSLFRNIQVIGQVDKKFIAVLEKENNLLILFDQHAVHERVRLEKLLKIYRDSKSECVENMIIFVPENDLLLLRKHESYLNLLGLSVEFFTNGINVIRVPFCLYSKFRNCNLSETLNKMVQQLIKEIIELLKTSRGVSLSTFPTLLQNIVNMEACRGSIKFGDFLTKEKCKELLDKLSTCDLPFQCAHGRPTLTPLLALDSHKKIAEPRVNFKNLGL